VEQVSEAKLHIKQEGVNYNLHLHLILCVWLRFILINQYQLL